MPGSRFVEYDTGQRRTHVLKRNLFPLVMLLAISPLTHAVPDAGGGNGPAPAARAAPPDPTKARKAFDIGFEEYQMASGLENAGYAMTGENALRNKEAVKLAMTRARDRFRVATGADASMKEAWNMLGYTSRKLGNYEESLAAYEKALELAPEYPEAIEYRAELFLLTGKLAQVKEAYASLLKSSPSYAGVLKTSMQDWVKANKPVQGLADADRKEFAAWVAKL
jgi:tetratricopeptide (TPR) repeat protein